METHKMLKLYLPGEINYRKEVFETPDGEVFEYDVSSRLLVPSKKNQKQIISNKHNGKKYIIDSKQYVSWKKQTESLFRKFYESASEAGVRLPIARCKAKVLFYFPDAKDRDLTNKFETIADELVANQIILDDSFKVMKPVHVDGWVCRDRPRTEVYLTVIPPTHKEYDWDATTERYRNEQLKKKAIQAKIRRRKASMQGNI